MIYRRVSPYDKQFDLKTWIIIWRGTGFVYLIGDKFAFLYIDARPRSPALLSHGMALQRISLWRFLKEAKWAALRGIWRMLFRKKGYRAELVPQRLCTATTTMEVYYVYGE